MLFTFDFILVLTLGHILVPSIIVTLRAKLFLFVCLFVGVFVCGFVTTITRNCVHRSSPNWVCR